MDIADSKEPAAGHVSGRTVDGTGNSQRGRRLGCANYYGRRFTKALDCWLEPGLPLSKKLINNHLTMWVAPWLDWMWNNDNLSKEKIDVADPHRNLLPVYGRNPRYWLCVYPLIVLPAFLGRIWAFPWLVRRKLLRLWYQTITPSVSIGSER